ncbi:MAG TPA: DUF423 domain-containing protein [Opitutaceae bacterium]|nr:DUF423 domain-containing protein [Opitutaceae bacterium]
MNESNQEQGNRGLLVTIGVFGTIGVVAGSLGAHALRDTLQGSEHVDVWQTAVLYNLMHAVACLAAINGGTRQMRTAVWFWLTGITLFSGSLYCLALGGPKWLGPITPLGGAFLIIGWIWVVVGAFTRNRRNTH